MKIRSITTFWDPTVKPSPLAVPAEFSPFRQAAVRRFTDGGVEVQTTRLATVEFVRFLDCHKGVKVVLAQAQDLEMQAKSNGFEYLSLGPVPAFVAEYLDFIPELLAGTRSVNFGGEIAQNGVIYPQVARKCAAVIHACRDVEPEGFANQRFAALAQVPPGVPFFPSAYHRGGKAAFALAMESADEAVRAFEDASSLEDARQNLLDALNGKAAEMEKIAASLSEEFNLDFLGFDFSLAPFPADTSSLGAAMEKLGLQRLGGAGSLAAAAFIADTLDLGGWKRSGFNGLMMPVLEDSRLARRSAEGSLTVRDLLMYSAVCGTGLDTMPLPGDVSEQDLTGLLLDVAALATRLGKPLTARLMPIPGKKAGDETSFTFDYFVNGRVLALEKGGFGGLLASAGVVDLKPRHLRQADRPAD